MDLLVRSQQGCQKFKGAYGTAALHFEVRSLGGSSLYTQALRTLARLVEGLVALSFLVGGSLVPFFAQ